MTTMSNEVPIIFDPQGHPLAPLLCGKLPAELGQLSYRRFPDGESYLRLDSPVKGRHCVVLVEMSSPDRKFLPLSFLTSTLRELEAASIGLVAPYLCYMRQDRRFLDGEAITSRIFAELLSNQVDWMVTVDPHLHRYTSLDEIYAIPTKVIQGAPVLAGWLKSETDVFVVGPDLESEQWVAQIAEYSGHPYVIGEKQRLGDRDVSVSLPDLSELETMTAVIIDDVISSGQTIIECMHTLRSRGVTKINCACVHGIFAGNSDKAILEAGLSELVTTNTIPHYSNELDVSGLLLTSIQEFTSLTREAPK